jgi:hypothetical protein
MISVDGLAPIETNDEVDPSRPKDFVAATEDGALPSSTNRVGLNEFSVGNYKEFKLREELGGLIEKYNKRFYGADAAKKPSMTSQEVKDSSYKDKMIINPMAVPDPEAAKGNYSWMYLMAPYYNEMVKEFNQS